MKILSTCFLSLWLFAAPTAFAQNTQSYPVGAGLKIELPQDFVFTSHPVPPSLPGVTQIFISGPGIKVSIFGIAGQTPLMREEQVKEGVFNDARRYLPLSAESAPSYKDWSGSGRVGAYVTLVSKTGEPVFDEVPEIKSIYLTMGWISTRNGSLKIAIASDTIESSAFAKLMAAIAELH